MKMFENRPNQLNHGGSREKLRRLVVKLSLVAALAATGLVASVNAQVAAPMNSSGSVGEKVANTTNTQAPSAVVAAATSQPDDRYRIGPGDVLDIRIFNRPNLSRDAVRVEGNGMIRMPLIGGEIKAACKTEGELAKEIATRYLKYYRNPQVDVFIKEYHAREVALIGAVTDQGRYQLSRRMRLLELLTYAKGRSDKAGETINIVRGSRPNLCETAPQPSDDASGFISLRL